MIIKIDSKYLEAYRDFLEALSVNRLDLVKALQAKFDLTEDTAEKLKISRKSNSLLGEAKAYHESSVKVNELLKELEEKFAVKGETE